MPQGDVSEAEPQEQAIGNDSVENTRNEKDIFSLHAGEIPRMMSPIGFP